MYCTGSNSNSEVCPHSPHLQSAVCQAKKPAPVARHASTAGQQDNTAACAGGDAGATAGIAHAAYRCLLDYVSALEICAPALFGLPEASVGLMRG